MDARFTYMPKAAPPKCAAWSKNFHPITHPAKSIPIITLIAAPAENVIVGRNSMLNCVSGYCAQTYASTVIIAPDYKGIGLAKLKQ